MVTDAALPVVERTVAAERPPSAGGDVQHMMSWAAGPRVLPVRGCGERT